MVGGPYIEEDKREKERMGYPFLKSHGITKRRSKQKRKQIEENELVYTCKKEEKTRNHGTKTNLPLW